MLRASTFPRLLRTGLTLALCAAAIEPSDTHAQDDWGVTRQPPRPNSGAPRAPRAPRAARNSTGDAQVDPQQALMERYLLVLARDADQPFALQRLLELYRERDGNLDRLIAELETRIGSGRSVYDYTVTLGDVERARGQHERARAAYERAANLVPDRPTALRAVGMLLVDQNNLAEGQAWLERAVAVSSRGEAKQELLRKLAEIALARDDFEAASGLYGRLSEDGGVYLAGEYARALSHKGEHRRAVEEYKRVIARLRGDRRVLAPLLIDLAKAQLADHQVDAAITTLKDARRVARSSGLGAEIDATLLDAYRRGGRLLELATNMQPRARTHEELALLARIWDELGDSAQAIAAYRRALAARGTAVDVRLALIALLSRDGRLEEVITEYRTLMRVAPREPRFVVELAQLLMETGQRDEAIALLDRASLQNPRDTRLHEALAQLFTRWNETERAARVLTLLTKMAPDDPMHWIVLGEEQIARGDREAAVASWRQIVRGSDASAQAHVTFGQLLVDHDMVNDAVSEFREALKRDGDSLDATRGLAEALERSRRDHEAVAQWERVIVLASQDRALRREARRRLIAIWMRTQQLRERLAGFSHRFALTGPAQGSDTEAGRFLAEGYERLARERSPQAAHFRELGEKVLQRIIELEPGDVEALTSLEHALASRGDLEGAIAVLERLLLADPPRARSYLAKMASHALALYRDDQAIAYAERSVALNTDDAQAHQRLGELYRARQDTERAIASFERAVKLNERLFDVYFALAELHLAQGRATAADRHLRHVMRGCPDDELVARATRASIQIHLGNDSLGDLEAELLPLALGHSQRPIYRRLVIELYDAMTQLWTTHGQRDAPAQSAVAKRALKPLLEALSDPDPEQGRTAVRILTQLRHPSAALPLLALAESDTDMEVRRNALLSAGAVATDELVPRLSAIASGPHRRLRDVAAWSLAALGSKAAQRELQKLLSSSLPVVRTYAALGLGASGDVIWIAPLIELLRRDRSPMVRSAAALCLSRWNTPQAQGALLASARGHDEMGATSWVVALGLSGAADAAPVLADAVFSAEGDAQRRALWALHALGQRAPLTQQELVRPPTLNGEADLWTPDLLEVRWTWLTPIAARWPAALEHGARHALMGTREGALLTLRGLLDALTSDPSGDNKAPLVTLVHALENELGKHARHPDPLVRAATITLLTRAGSPQAADRLDAALEDSSEIVRTAALQVMPSLAPDTTRGIPALIELARNAPQWSMRLHAVEALGSTHGEAGAQACDALVHALGHDRYAFVREHAARWVGARCADPTRRAALDRAATDDPEPRVRIAADKARSTIP